jgi:hypothetical protein
MDAWHGARRDGARDYQLAADSMLERAPTPTGRQITIRFDVLRRRVQPVVGGQGATLFARSNRYDFHHLKARHFSSVGKILDNI